MLSHLFSPAGCSPHLGESEPESEFEVPRCHRTSTPFIPLKRPGRHGLPAISFPARSSRRSSPPSSEHPPKSCGMGRMIAKLAIRQSGSSSVRYPSGTQASSPAFQVEWLLPPDFLPSASAPFVMARLRSSLLVLSAEAEAKRPSHPPLPRCGALPGAPAQPRRAKASGSTSAPVASCRRQPATVTDHPVSTRSVTSRIGPSTGPAADHSSMSKWSSSAVTR